MDAAELQSWLSFKIQTPIRTLEKARPRVVIKGAGIGLVSNTPKGYPLTEDCAFRSTAIDISARGL